MIYTCLLQVIECLYVQAMARLFLLVLVAVIVGSVSAGKPYNVTYDNRAIIIDGQRRMLISAGIHYPRATPEVRTFDCKT